MIQKFRWRFIGISILSLLLVMVVSVGGLVGITFYRDNQDVNRVMSVLVQNDGNLGPRASGDLGKRQNTLIDGHSNPESIYQYHYFTVVDDDGQLVLVNRPKNFNLNMQQIGEKSVKALAKKDKLNENVGVVQFDSNRYRYQIFTNKQGHKTIVFLNTTLIFSSAWSLLRLSIIFLTIALIFFAIILILLSRKAIEPIASAYKKQHEFITNAGHELKTPLSIIAANTEMQEILGNDNEWTESTKEQTQRLTELINRLISLARMSEGNEIVLSNVNASEIVEKVSKSFQSIMMKNELTYQTEIDPDIMVQAEEKSFRELVNIFLDNAQKYCDEHGKIAVSLHKGKFNNYGILTISNTYKDGKNVDYNHFFDRFYRGDESHNSKKSGYGIGLSMASNLVQVFKGKIKVNYQDDTISFVIQLKLAK